MSRVAPLIGVMSLALVAACSTGSEGGGDTIAITSSDSACDVASQEIPTGNVTFSITNSGSDITEVYVFYPDGKIVSERENIAPGTTVSDFTVTLPEPGKYEIACVPGMKGDGIRKPVTVTGSAAGKKDEDPRLADAVKEYRTYVNSRLDDTITKTKEFVAAVKAGDVDKAKEIYAPSRVGWESIEPVAEAFGDIDPKVDAREADLKEGEKWTGWHRLEKALWKAPDTLKAESKYTDQLLKDLGTLKAKLPTLEITSASMSNGAKELLDEVATGKVTGEEEAFSHTDLWDFKANVDGAEKVFELQRAVVEEKDPDLAKTLRTEFANVAKALEKHEKGDGYVSYDTVGKDERKKLADAVDALAEPLSKLATTVTK